MPRQEPGTDVVDAEIISDGSNGAGAGGPESSDPNELMRIVTGQQALGEETVESTAVIEQIVSRVLSAETVEDVLSEGSTVATRELVGIPLQIRDYRLMKGNLADNPDASYMIIDAINGQTGEMIAINTGSPKVMAQVIRLKQLGKLPAECKVIEVGTATAGKNRALQLAAL